MLSMTGYGSAQTERDGRVITVEVKSVNHRFLDLAFRLPKGLMFLEDTLRQGVSARISRGHAEVFVTYKNRRADAVRMTVNEELAALYRDAVSRLAGVLGKNDDCGTSFFASLPDMITLEEAEEDRDAVAALASETLDKALDGLLEMRRREGLRMWGRRRIPSGWRRRWLSWPTGVPLTRNWPGCAPIFPRCAPPLQWKSRRAKEWIS